MAEGAGGIGVGSSALLAKLAEQQRERTARRRAALASDFLGSPPELSPSARRVAGRCVEAAVDLPVMLAAGGAASHGAGAAGRPSTATDPAVVAAAAVTVVVVAPLVGFVRPLTSPTSPPGPTARGCPPPVPAGSRPAALKAGGDEAGCDELLLDVVGRAGLGAVSLAAMPAGARDFALARLGRPAFRPWEEDGTASSSSSDCMSGSDGEGNGSDVLTWGRRLRSVNLSSESFSSEGSGVAAEGE